ncbi:hypothetical protein BKA62DRAFT_713003 [Auriculariales sp. MPI-PUGE-AT-0066]|nr:hypothetical protein BKA62DRAFT_713003 [Auriculariales sp. MPI-PUGE-AT-0066]
MQRHHRPLAGSSLTAILGLFTRALVYVRFRSLPQCFPDADPHGQVGDDPPLSLRVCGGGPSDADAERTVGSHVTRHSRIAGSVI